MLADAGMETPYSQQRAKKIKEERELAAELASIQQAAPSVNDSDDDDGEVKTRSRAPAAPAGARVWHILLIDAGSSTDTVCSAHVALRRSTTLTTTTTNPIPLRSFCEAFSLLRVFKMVLFPSAMLIQQQIGIRGLIYRRPYVLCHDFHGHVEYLVVSVPNIMPQAFSHHATA